MWRNWALWIWIRLKLGELKQQKARDLSRTRWPFIIWEVCIQAHLCTFCTESPSELILNPVQQVDANYMSSQAQRTRFPCDEITGP